MTYFKTVLIVLLSITYETIAQSSTQNLKFKVSEIHDFIKNGKTCLDIVQYYLERVYRYNGNIGAIININSKVAQEAVKLDKYYEKNKRLVGRLHCVPLIVKDNIDVAGIPTTGGIKALRYSVPNTDATVIKRLKLEGVIVIAKANLAELAAGATNTETGGECYNPYDSKRTCGPSSTGSGAAIATGMGVIALGTDTDGSIMNPSSYCGVYGLRTQQYDIEVDGIIPSFQRQDTVGPMARHLDDLVLTYSIIANDISIFDKYQAPTLPSTLRVGYIKNFLNTFEVKFSFTTLNYVIDNKVSEEFYKMVDNLKSLNIQVFEQELSANEMKQMNEILELLTISRISGCQDGCFKTHMDEYLRDTLRFQDDAPYNSFDEILQSSLLSDTWKHYFTRANVNDPANTCKKACTGYDLFKEQFTTFIKNRFAYNNLDAILLPTSGVLPYLTNGDSTGSVGNIIGPNFIAPATGYSTLSIPVSFTPPATDAPDGLPIGMMLLSKKNNLINTFKIAKFYEIAYVKPKLPSSTPLIANKNLF